MKYVSTRGESDAVTFEDVLLAGYAPDGGLYVPETLPNVPWKEWKELSYQDVVLRLLPYFGVPNDLLTPERVAGVYEKFNESVVVGVTELTEGLNIMELFHGPTMAFKDYALCLLGEILQAYLEKQKRRHVVFVATSGDTGSSALEATARKANIDTVCFYPHGRVTEIQRRQMTTIDADNVHVFAGEGTSDELDDALRELFVRGAELTKNTTTSIGCLNSINWARIMAQIAHWIYTFLKLSPNLQPLTFAIPTGACGNIASGFYAKALGLPIRIVACTGPNDFVYQLVHKGCATSSLASVSLCSAMDIQNPYNIERVLYLLSGQNSALISSLMKVFAATGKLSLSSDLHAKLLEELGAVKVSDEEIRASVAKTYKDFAYYTCPHSATALSYAYQHPEIRPLVCCATASAQKFPEVFQELGIKLTPSEAVKTLLQKPEVKHPLLKAENKHLWSKDFEQKLLCLLTK